MESKKASADMESKKASADTPAEAWTGPENCQGCDFLGQFKKGKVMVAQTTRIVSPFPPPDDRLYRICQKGNTMYLYWSEMSRAQRQTQRALEQDQARMRAEYIAEFGIYS
jgi:hypothetical protein